MYNKIRIMDMLLKIFYEIILKSIYILYLIIITVSNVFDTLAVDHNAHAIANAYPKDELIFYY